MVHYTPDTWTAGDWTTILILSVVLGLIPGYIAWRKGYPFFAWWFAGAVVSIITLPITIFMKTEWEELDRRRMNNHPDNSAKNPPN